MQRICVVIRLYQILIYKACQVNSPAEMIQESDGIFTRFSLRSGIKNLFRAVEWLDKRARLRDNGREEKRAKSPGGETQQCETASKRED